MFHLGIKASSDIDLLQRKYVPIYPIGGPNGIKETIFMESRT